jgi:hypothetical protein
MGGNSFALPAASRPSRVVTAAEERLCPARHSSPKPRSLSTKRWSARQGGARAIRRNFAPSRFTLPKYLAVMVAIGCDLWDDPQT